MMNKKPTFVASVNLLLSSAVIFPWIISIANAQNFNVYGYQGFVLQLKNGPPLTNPAWVQPQYAFNLNGHLLQPFGIINNSQLQLYNSIETPNGDFYTPIPPDTSIAGSVLNVNGSPVGIYGAWSEQISGLVQEDLGVYFAGNPAAYTGSFDESAVVGAYGGTVTGYMQTGYSMTGISGCVTITVLGSITGAMINMKLEGNRDTFAAKGQVTALGITFTGTGQASSDYVNVDDKGTDFTNYSISGGGKALFIGDYGTGISGLFYATNTSGPPDGGVVIAAAFGAGKGKPGCQ